MREHGTFTLRKPALSSVSMFPTKLIIVFKINTTQFCCVLQEMKYHENCRQAQMTVSIPAGLCGTMNIFSTVLNIKMSFIACSASLFPHHTIHKRLFSDEMFV